jgi:hypothetical protein
VQLFRYLRNQTPWHSSSSIKQWHDLFNQTVAGAGAGAAAAAAAAAAAEKQQSDMLALLTV